MANYKLAFKQSVSKDLRSIPKRDVVRILQRAEELQKNPHPVGSEKLSGQERYRIRQGVYRIIYEVSNQLLIVTVVKVAHRQHTYKQNLADHALDANSIVQCALLAVVTDFIYLDFG